MNRSPVLLALALATAGCAGTIRDRIYHPPRATLAAAPMPPGDARVEVRTSDGLTLTGVEVPPRDRKPTLLVLHGNAASAAAMPAWFAPLIARGYGIVAAEYRGYGGNPGRPDERGLSADAEAFHAEARRIAGAGKVYVVGHSLGGGVAFDLARHDKLDALITIGTFSRLRAMAPRVARAFIADRYDNLAAIPTLDEPWFLIHGARDTTVPPSEGQRLRRAAMAGGKVGAAFLIAGASHHPDGATLADLIVGIDRQLREPGTRVDLPATVTAFPFR